LVACGSSTVDTPNYTVLEEHDLPKVLQETSGLYCPKVDFVFTINDSGNEPIIYDVNHTGHIINEKVVAAKNKDWEALTGDDKYFYVGDIGNNSGKRQSIQIHVVPKHNNNTKSDITSLNIFYTNNSVKKNRYLNHDFDAEALINVENNLLLFSKSWDTGILYIYQLNKIEPKQNARFISTIGGLPGVITGGDFDSKNNRFILIGYELKGLGSFNPFIVIINEDLTLQKFFRLPGYGQVEGLCVTPNAEVWFTQESSFFSNHKLVKLNVAWIQSVSA
jgi:hypothetical protein